MIYNAMYQYIHIYFTLSLFSLVIVIDYFCICSVEKYWKVLMYT